MVRTLSKVTSGSYETLGVIFSDLLTICKAMASVGPTFGVNGYMRFKRGVNMCGIENQIWAPCH